LFSFQYFPQKYLLAFGILALITTAVLDYFTGFEVNFTAVYLVALFLLTLAVEKKWRIWVALLTAVISMSIDWISKPTELNTEIFAWNLLMDFILFIGLPQILSAYIDAINKQIFLAKIDMLTGLLNRNAFYELAEKELLRSERYNHVFSIAYIDCDNFKTVNDTMGHAAGDALLNSIANILKSNLRATDFIARLGGDEFIILFPETGEEASELIFRIKEMLIAKMIENKSAITFSIGLSTYKTPPYNIDDVISKADNLMYDIKHSGKNGFKCGTY